MFGQTSLSIRNLSKSIKNCLGTHEYPAKLLTNATDPVLLSQHTKN